MSGNRWQDLETEARNPNSRGLDTLETDQIVTLLLEADREGLERALDHRASIARAAEWFAEAFLAGGTIHLLGAGTSGRLAVLEAAECPPTFGTDPERIRGSIAGGNDAMFRATEGAEDDFEAGVAAVDATTEKDLVIGLSASSVTRFTLGALSAARERGARSVLLTCASSRGLSRSADLVIGLDTGPEVLTGSTRLKAGSATKAALNAISTAAMVRVGKVFDNLMVDLRPGSAKLANRALRITSEAGRTSSERARELLDHASGEVKTAIVMARLDVDVETARRRLATAEGHLRTALELDE